MMGLVSIKKIDPEEDVYPREERGGQETATATLRRPQRS